MPRYHSYHLQLPHFYFDNSKQMRLIYGIRIVRDLVARISFFFIPVFLYQLGHNQLSYFFEGLLTPFQVGMIAVAGYYLIHRSTVLLAGIPIAAVTKTLGLGRTMAMSHFIYLLVFSLLMVVNRWPWLIILAAVADGLQTNLFWTPFHALLSKHADKRHMGQDLGLVQFFLQLGAVLAPAFAGAAIITLGYSSVFILAVIGVLLSTIFAFQLEHDKVSDRPTFQALQKWLQHKQFRRLSISYAGRYLNDAMLAVWPLYIFLLLGAVDKVGYLYTVSLFLAMFFSLLMGSFVDHHKEKKWFITSGSILSGLWVIRSFISSIWSIAIVDTLERFSSNFHWLFFDALFLRGGKGSKPLTYFTFREMALSMCGVLFWTFFALFFIFSESWTILFVLAAVGVLCSLLVNDSSEKQVQ